MYFHPSGIISCYEPSETEATAVPIASLRVAESELLLYGPNGWVEDRFTQPRQVVLFLCDL